MRILIVSLAALDLLEFGCYHATSAGDVFFDSCPLSVEPKSGQALLVGANPEIGDEFWDCPSTASAR